MWEGVETPWHDSSFQLVQNPLYSGNATTSSGFLTENVLYQSSVGLDMPENPLEMLDLLIASSENDGYISTAPFQECDLSDGHALKGESRLSASNDKAVNVPSQSWKLSPGMLLSVLCYNVQLCDVF